MANITGISYLLILFVFILLAFLVLKRPIYEVVLGGFFLMLTITGTWANIFQYVRGAFSTSLVYAIFAFVAFSQLLTKTKVIDDCIDVILSLLGRLPGGAGYVAVIGSVFMGALSGSGPGNVVATGVITIPAMKRSGFPNYLAANIESTASTMGNLIPPSGVIVASFGCYQAICPDSAVTIGNFWLVLWGVAIYFILHRLVTVFVLCKRYKIPPMPKEEIPDLKTTLRRSWKGLFLPLIILAPFVLDALFKSSFFTQRLGVAGANSLSSSLLLMTAGVSSFYVCLISRDRKAVRVKEMAKLFSKSAASLVPTLSTVIFAYMIGEIFSDIRLGEEIGALVASLNMSRIAIAFFIPLFTTFLGMMFPGSSQIAMFGTMLVSVFVKAGISPLLAAAMLPTICGAMSGITPPVAVCTFAAMGIAESDYRETVLSGMSWIIIQYILSVLLLLGLLPVMGL